MKKGPHVSRGSRLCTTDDLDPEHVKTPDDLRLLAMLVHQGDISRDVAEAAMASGDPAAHLAQAGIASPKQWSEWQRTAGGTRPVLSRYELGDVLGEGGVGRVFRATDRTTGEIVALKVLRSELSKNPTEVQRFIQEARLLMRIQSDHVVRGLRVAKEADTIFFAMEPVDGPCLQDILSEQGRLSEHDALLIVAETARGLADLHAEGLVHRDVKPGNILWSETRGAVLIDLGFAIAVDAELPDGDEESTAGTVAYIAPEQAKGRTDLDVRADIYALGATLYHLVTGSLPFAGEDNQEILAKQVLASLSGDRIRELGLSPQTHYFIEKMMAKEKEIRFQDPTVLADELLAHLQRKEREDQASEDRGPSRPTRRSSTRRRRFRP